MDLLDKAIIFAVNRHAGQIRKMAKTPFIVHPMEAAAIAATMTDDLNVLAAAVLHDTIEDAGVTPEEILHEFGEKVYALVATDTENKMADRDPNETWQQRKEESLNHLKNTTDINEKIIWLSDKLSNMRSFYREYKKTGNEMWRHFHQKDPKMQAWYYNTVVDCLKELEDFAAYREYRELVWYVFRNA